MAMTFQQMVNSRNVGDITRAELRVLSNAQLEVFARLLGTAYSGDKNKRVNRIFDALNVRYFLIQSEDPKFYEQRYSRRELIKMVKRAAIFAGSTKYGLAVGLLNWRKECRRKGTSFYQEMKAEAAKQPKQIRLF